MGQCPAVCSMTYRILWILKRVNPVVLPIVRIVSAQFSNNCVMYAVFIIRKKGIFTKVNLFENKGR